MTQAFANLIALLRRPEILAICAVVFMADVQMGIVASTFSLYAGSLGATPALIGALTGFTSLIAMGAALPIGVLSDRRGRRNVIAAGMLCFVLAPWLYTLAPTAWWLFPTRALASLGALAVFMVSAAYLGDIVTRQERGLAVGIFATAMSLGFTVGPALGGLIAARYGYHASYYLAALLALIGFGVALRGLKRISALSLSPGRSPSVAQAGQLRLLLRNPLLMAASLGNLCNNMAYGVLFGFFPLYAATLGLDEAAIGGLFAARALASTVTRLPTGLLTTRLPSHLLLSAALLLDLLVMLALAGTTQPLLLALLLAGDGIAYGMFLTAGQSLVTETAGAAERGAAIGLYTVAGSIGGAAGPFALGLVAEAWGLASVFVATAALMLLGVALLWVLSVRQRRLAVLPG